MISIIYGAKGTGKTKQIIDRTNGAVASAKGNIIYVTDTKEHSLSIKPQVRYVNVKEYGIGTLDALNGFVKGMLSVNYDIETIFIDGAARFAGVAIADLKPLFAALENFNEVNFVLTVSSDYKVLPDFIKKFTKE